MQIFLVLGSLFGALAVIIGAFGAHGLKDRIPPEMMEVYRTGVDYHFYHVAALLVVGVLGFHLAGSLSALRLSGWFFVAGICLFSGSLYLLAITEIRWLGAITPLGGIFFILGWLALAWACWKHVQ